MNLPIPKEHGVHSVYSFSSSSRWFEDACPASIRMTRGMNGKTNPSAELGTGAHELGEFCIGYGANPTDCIGMQFGIYTHNKEQILVDAAMAEAVNLYVGYANDLMIRTGCTAQLEVRVVMSSLGRDDVYGTSDLALAHLAERTLYVSDYKHGYELVDVPNNKQLIAYAIAYLDTYNLWQHIDRVVTTIIQPRKPHINGCIRSHTYTTTELVSWQLRFANSIKLAEDNTTKPYAGEHCLYCIKTKCRARLLYVLDHAYQDAPDDELTDTEVLIVYNHLPVMKRFAQRIEEETLEIARKTGQVPEGCKPVKSIKWAIVENEKGLIEAIKAKGIDPIVMYKKDLISKTAARKLIPAEVVNQFYKVPPSSTTIVKLNDNRPAIRVGSVEGVFKPITNTNMKGY